MVVLRELSSPFSHFLGMYAEVMVSRASISPSQTFPRCTTRRPPRPPPSPPATWAVAARVPSRARSCSPPRSASIGGSSRSVRPTVFRVALRPSAPDAPPPAVKPPQGGDKLSLYLSCQILDTAFSPDTIPTTLMFGIREPKEQIGKREGRDGWIWKIWENEW